MTALIRLAIASPKPPDTIIKWDDYRKNKAWFKFLALPIFALRDHDRAQAEKEWRV